MARMKKYRKKIFMILATTVVLGVSGINLMSAYYNDTHEKENIFTVGGVRIDLIEEFEPPKELKADTTFKKDVSVKNVGENDCYVRIKAVFTDSDMGKYSSLDLDSSEDKNDNSVHYWYNSEDGYHYLKNELKVGEQSPSLFTEVHVSKDIPAEEIKEFDILIYTESFQSYGFDNYEEAWEYYGRNNPNN